MDKKILVWVGVVAMLSLSGIASAEEGHKYTGVKKCSMCHKSDAKGNQHGQWLSSKHAQAYEALKTDAAKATAAEKGIDDPTKADECLRCHTTGHGADAALIGDKFKVEDGVQCESCHGAGGDYYTMKVMKNKEESVAKGLVKPTKELCVKCHNEESPTFVSFDFDAMYKKIAHPRPE